MGAARNWLIGCGIGCGVVILFGALLIGGGAYWVRGIVHRFDDATERVDSLDERFGQAEDWVPPVHGAIAPARLEAFLAVRDSTAELRERFRTTFASFERLEQDDREDRKPAFRDVLQAVRGGLGMAPLIGDYIAARAAALDAADMGPGEYMYIYSLGYYAFLGRNPDAGPGKVHVESEDLDRDARRRSHRLLLALLSNQRNAADSLATARSWRDSLSAEISALEADDRRVAWQDGLPPAIAASFAPFRERLEATWSEEANIFELGRFRRGDRRMQFEFGD